MALPFGILVSFLFIEHCQLLFIDKVGRARHRGKKNMLLTLMCFYVGVSGIYLLNAVIYLPATVYHEVW